MDEESRTRELASRYGKEYVDLSGFRIASELLRTLPAELMFRYNFVPLEETKDGELAIAIADPTQLLMIDEIEMLLKRRIETRVSTLRQISNTLKRTEGAQREGHE